MGLQNSNARYQTKMAIIRQPFFAKRNSCSVTLFNFTLQDVI